MKITQREYHCWSYLTPQERRFKIERLKIFLKFFESVKNVVDLGCGDGVFIELFQNVYPQKNIIGIENNEELYELCQSYNLPVLKDDIISFLEKNVSKFDGFVLLDVIEHLDFEQNLKIFNLIPPGGIVLVKTPNTNSLLGHQYYLQAPSHKSPYSPFVIKKILERYNFTLIAEGETDGILSPKTLLGKIRFLLLKLIFKEHFNLFFGGGNYFCVARKL